MYRKEAEKDLAAAERAAREQADALAAKQATEKARAEAKVRLPCPTEITAGWSHSGEGTWNCAFVLLCASHPLERPSTVLHPLRTPPVITQKRELADMVRQLDEQARVKQEGIAREITDKLKRAEWLRADELTMRREMAEKTEAAARNVLSYRSALEGQISDSFSRSGQYDETPFERARNGRLISDLLSQKDASRKL